MPPPRPTRPVPPRPAAKPAPPPETGPKDETVLAPAPVPRPAPKPAPKPATRPVAKAPPRPAGRPAPRPPVDEVEVDDDEEDADAAPATRRPQRGRSSGDKRRLILILGGIGLAVIGLIVLAALWGPMKRSRQIAAFAAATDADAAIALANEFANDWDPRSNHTVALITSGKGMLEARLHLCRIGSHMRLLAQILGDDKLTPAQRGLVCAALSEAWPDDGSGPGVSPSLSDWALNPSSDPALATPALRLMVAIAAPDSETHLARAAADGRLSAERAVAVAVALGEILKKRNLGVAPLLGALAGAHRAALLASPAVAEAVRENATPADAGKLLALLDKPDSTALGLAGLGGKRFQLGESDAKARAELTQQLLPFLAPNQDDAVLAGALMVVHRQRLHGARKQVIALLPRLSSRRPPQLKGDDIADLLGKSLVSTKTPEAAAAAEEMVAALTDALDNAGTRAIAIVALSRVQEASVPALRLALDSLAGYGEDGGAALEILVTRVYGREDIAKAARGMGWSKLLAEDRRKRARHDAILRWLSEHADENNARVESKIMAENKAELDRMSAEILGWLESKEPLPLGITRKSLEELANRVQLMKNMVLKGTRSN